MTYVPRRIAILLPYILACTALLSRSAQEQPVLAFLPDLVPVATDARVEPVHVVISAHDEGLLALIRSDASRPAMTSPAFLGTTVRPRPIAEGEPAAAEPEYGFDVEIDVHFYVGADLDGVVDRVVKTLAEAWYAESARLIPYLPLRDAAVAEEAPPADTVRPVVLYRIGVRLAPIDIARSYWRVALPVSVRAPLEPANLDRAGAWAEPVPLVVTFGSSSDTTDAPAPFVAVTGSYAPHLEPAIAVGYVPRERSSEHTVVSVDPLNRIAESDETNNIATVPLELPQAAENLAIVRNSVRAAPVEVTASAGCEALLDLISSQTASFPGCPLVPDWVRVEPRRPVPMPEDTPDAGPETPVPMPADITVTFGWRTPCPEPDDVAAKAAEFFRQQWYCEDARVIPLPYAAADPAEPDENSGSSAAAPIAPWAVMIGIRIAPVDVLMVYTRVQAVVQRLVVMPREEANPIPERRCIAVDVIVTDEDGTTSQRHEVTALHANTARTVVSFVETQRLPAEAFSGIVAVDPDNAVTETDERDNTAEFGWAEPPPPDARLDLFPEQDAARTRTVTCIPSVESPVLLELIRRSGIDALADIPGFRTVNVLPLHRQVHDLDALVAVMPSLPEFDLVVVGLFEEPDVSSVDPVERLLERFAGEWYAAEVAPAEMPASAAERLLGAPSAVLPIDRYAAAVLVKLTDAKIAKRYWRLSVPVVCRSWNAPSPVLPEEPRLGIVDMLAEAGRAGRTEDAEPAPPLIAPQLVTVAFSANFEPPAANSTPSFTRDHVWVMPNRHALAVGFLPMEGSPLEGTAVVDPDNLITEFNEENNTASFGPKGEPEPPVPGRFHARAHWLLAEDGVRTLVVEGTLTNVGDDVIRIRFNSGLQMDFRFGETYRWSHDKMFTMAITEVELLPGEQKTWRLTVPAYDLKWDGEPVVIEAFLVGTHYRHLFRFPGPPEPFEPDDSVTPAEPGPDEAIDVIVPPNGVVLDRLPAWTVVRQNGCVLDKEPEGNILDEMGTWVYQGLGGFAGQDYLVVRSQNEGSEDAVLMCRLKVGTQTFRLPLEKGWNLVSLPIRPAGGLQDLLDAIPGSFAWIWSDGAYQPATDAEPGRGMWLFSMDNMVLEFVGEPAPTADLPLSEGWNLVGTVNDAAYGGLPGITATFGERHGILTPKDAVRSGEALWIFAEPGATVPLN